MNCQDVTNLLDDRLSVDSMPARQRSLDAHLLECEKCQQAWHASQTLRSLGDARVPAPRPSLFEEAMQIAADRPEPSSRIAPFWVGGALGAALAASVALIAFVGIDSPVTSDRSVAQPGIEIALYETRDITLAIDSPEALTDAQIHVALTGGIELQGRPGRQDVRWTADINAGVNRLTIPVVAVSDHDAELLVEIVHGSKHRRVVVPLDVLPSDESAATG